MIRLMHGRPNHDGRRTRRRGAAAVEFALTAPILFTLLFAALELGRANLIRQTANNAAYEAARLCVVPGATAADGEAKGQQVLRSIGVRSATVDIQPDPILNTTPQVTATVTVPFAQNMWTKSLFCGTGSVTVTCKLTRDWVVSTRQSSP
jgi:Flp pilus assembly protein TadG